MRVIYLGRKMSRQRMSQLKHQAKGLCMRCGGKRVNGTYCEKHREIESQRRKKEYAEKKLARLNKGGE